MTITSHHLFTANADSLSISHFFHLFPALHSISQMQVAFAIDKPCVDFVNLLIFLCAGMRADHCYGTAMLSIFLQALCSDSVSGPGRFKMWI